MLSTKRRVVIGKLLRRARERSNLSQRELATAAGVQFSTVVRLEAQGLPVDVGCNLTTAKKLAQVLGVTVATFSVPSYTS